MDIYEDHARSLNDSVRLTRRGFAVAANSCTNYNNPEYGHAERADCAEHAET